MKLFFATDVHGSEICWKKFVSAGKFYGADVLILGGDMTGKAIVPIIAQGNDKYKVTLLEQESILDGKEQVDKMAFNHSESRLLSLCNKSRRSGRDLLHTR